MASREQSDQQPLHHVFLPYDDSVRFMNQPFYKTALVADFPVDFLDVFGEFHFFLED